MTPAALVPMRLCATVAHALPGVRLRLRDGGRTLLEVVRTPEPTKGVVAPCAFRNAVGRAHRQLEAGHRLHFLGLDEGVAPAIDIAVAPDDRIHPGGLYRVVVGDTWVHAFATTLTTRTCRAILNDLQVAGDLVLHGDPATDITIVHAHRRGAAALEIPGPLQEAMIRCAGEELTGELCSLALTRNAEP